MSLEGQWIRRGRATVFTPFVDVIGDAELELNGVSRKKTSGLIVQAGQQVFTSAGNIRNDTINFPSSFSSGSSYGLSVAIAQNPFSIVLLIQVSALNAGSFNVVAGSLVGGPTTYTPIPNGQNYTVTWVAIGD